MYYRIVSSKLFSPPINSKTNMNISGSSKRYVFIFFAAIFALFSFFNAQAQNLRISGSNNHSVVICANGNVFAWGKNNDGQLGLDPNTNAAYGVAASTTPLRVGGLGEIFQIDAGSGSHTLALTCQGKVYAWGTNAFNQLGNNTDAPGASSAKPVLVKAGATGTGDLMGVKYVSGGNDESYALLNNGRAVAWGQNDKGQLGDGTITNRPAPVYILNGQTGQPLENIIQIEAGDENGYALTSDGRVWSWGDAADGAGVALGRANIAQNTRAYPVQVRGGADLTGIKEITAGDRHCLALSTGGQVYSWGGDWGSGQLGQGLNYQNFLYASLVVGGAAGGTYLGDTDPVVSIAAGQAHSVVATASGRVYSWGSNGLFNCGTGCSTPAGQLGTNTLTTQISYSNNSNAGLNESPMQSLNGNAPFTNAVSVSDGDAWSFVLTRDGKIYGSGWNTEGQLAIAGNANQFVFREINIPNCGVTAPCPDIDLGPDLKFCKTFTHTFSAGIVYPDFEAILYKNDVRVTSVLIGRTEAAREVTFPVTEYANEWKIEIIDRRGPTDRPCDPCPVARDSIKIEEYIQTFTDPGNLTYCGDTLKPNVLPNGQAGKDPAYFWYATTTSTAALDTTFGSGKGLIKLPQTGVSKAANGDITLYVEERGYASGYVYKKAQSCNPNFDTFEFLNNNQAQNPNYQSQFVAYEPITLVETKVKVRVSVYSTNSTVSGVVRMGVYGTKLDNNGNPIADNTKLLRAFNVTVTATRDASATDKFIMEYTVPINLDIPGTPAGYYFYISPTGTPLSGLTGSGSVEIGTATCTQTGFPIKDDVTGLIVTHSGMGQAFQNFSDAANSKGGHFYDVRFKTGQRYCYRIPVVLKESCPCNKPTSVDVKNTKALSIRCIGDTLTLKGDYKNAGKPLLNGSMYYVWYKQGATVTVANYTALTAPSPATSTANFPVPNNPLSPVALATSGVYVLRVQDGNDPAKTSCFTEDTVTVKIGDRPNRPRYTGDSTLCIGERLDLTAASPVKTGVTIKQYTWKNLTSGVTAGGTLNARITKNNVVAADGTTFRAIVESTEGCKDSSTVTVKVDAAPAKPTFTGDSSLCPSQSLNIVALSAGTPAATKYKWTFPSATVAPRADTINDPLNNTLSKAQVAATDGGRYKVVAISALGCKDSASVGVIVNPLPARPGITGDSLLCEGSNLNLTAASAPKAGVTIGNYIWKKPAVSTAAASGGQGQIMGKTGVAPTEAGRYEVVAVSSEGCRDSSRVNVKIDAKPTVPVISTNGGADIIMCGSDQQLAIDPASYTAGKVKWTNDKGLAFNDAVSAQADTLKTTKAVGFVNNTGTAEFTVTVTNGICPAVTDKIKVTRSGELTAPNLVSDNGKLTVCLNGSLSFTGNAKNTTNLEVSGWSWSPRTNITVDSSASANLNKARFTFAAIGTYDIIYTIDNPTCPAKTEKLTVTVVAPPIAVITDPNTLNGNIKEKSINPDNYQLVAQAAGVGYTGTWSKKSGQGDINSTSGNLTDLSKFETTVPSGVGTTDLIWTVTDNTNSCPAAKDSARIIRRDITVPNLGPDTIKCVSVLPFTRRTNAGDIIPGIESIQWFGQTAFVSGTNIVVPAGTAPGTYQVVLHITNTPANLVSKDTFNIKVDAESIVPTLSLVGTKANPYLICSQQFTMPGIATAQGPLSVNWWNKINGTGKLTDSLLVNTTMTGITGVDTVTARFWNKNGVCPAKSIDFVLKKVGDITPTEVKLDGTVAGGKTYTNENLTVSQLADTLCLGGTYTLSAIKLPTASEQGTWRVVSGTSVSLGSPLSGNTQSLTVNSPGSTVIEWKIENASLASCNPNVLQVTLVVQAPPTITSVVGPTTPPCEDDDNVANGRVRFTSTLKNPKFTWAVVPSATASATLLTTKDSLVNFTNFVSTAPKGEKDSVNFTVTVSNACGTDAEPLNVVFKLKPRELFVGDTISGPTIICESWEGVGYLFDHVQPNTTNIRWYWNSTLQTTTPNLGQTDTAVYLRNNAWGDVSVVTNATVLAQLGNVCGYGKDTTLQVEVIPAVDFDFKVVSDRFDQVENSFCVPLDVVGIFALQTLPDSTVQGNVAQYEFQNKTGAVFKPLSPSRTFYSSFAHDTTVVVNATPYGWACLNDYSVKSREIRLKGYDKPFDSLAVVKDSICEDEGNGKVLLSLSPNPPSRNRGNVTWYKAETGGPVAVGTGPSYEVSGPSTGTYYASIENALKLKDPSTTCPGNITKEAKVKIYDKPDPVFATDLLVIYYNENDPGVQMPLVTTGTVDSIIYKHYDNGIWLNSQDSLLPIIKTTRDEMTIEYLLELRTGNVKAEAVCYGYKTIKVLNALPLRIPNAFSPNNDGKNETWVIDGLNKYPDVKVRVFNRWGNSMFTDQDGVYEPWDGRTNGADLASGTYYYVIDLKGSPDGTDDVKVGSLTIVR